MEKGGSPSHYVWVGGTQWQCCMDKQTRKSPKQNCKSGAWDKTLHSCRDLEGGKWGGHLSMRE